jgi:hypothetical protein
MNFNISRITTLVSELNGTIISWFCGEQNTTRKSVASAQQHRENQAVGMFGMLVSGDESNRH